MVQEYRKIMFSADEVVSAYESYRRVSPGLMPSGKLTFGKVLPDCSVSLLVETGNGKQEQVVMRGLDVLKPMIRFCLENNIVLPRNGRKSISVINAPLCTPEAFGLALNIEIDINVEDSVTPLLVTHLSGVREVYPGSSPSLYLTR